MSAANIIKLILSVSIPLAVGAVAGTATAREIPGWYAGLVRPGIAPPNWVFGPVWTTLYILMGISLYLVWKLPPDKVRNLAMAAFGIQLVLNFFWTFIFFSCKAPGWAFVEIIALWIMLGITIVLFYRLKPAAAWINLPYLLWVSFAAILTWSYWRLNR